MSQRMEKINELLKEELAKLIQKEIEIEGFVTVTACETTPDLKKAKVWLSILGKDEGEVLKEVQNKASLFQHILGKKLFLKNTPSLEFRIDKSTRVIEKIEEILRKK